jgi:hypothetical protein
LPIKKQRRDPAYIQKRQDSERKKRERQQYEAQIEIIGALNRISDQLAADEEAEKRDHRKQGCRDWATILLIFATVIVAGTGDVFFYGQLNEMAKAYIPIKTQADAAKEAADATLNAQRAWVGPMNASLDSKPTESQTIKITVEYTNSGKEPAIEVGRSLKFKIFRKLEKEVGDLDDFALQEKNKCFLARVLQGAQVAFPAASYKEGVDTNSEMVSSEERLTATKGLAEGQDYLGIVGCFVYRTVDVYHHTSFCYFYQGTISEVPRLSICDAGNDAD